MTSKRNAAVIAVVAVVAALTVTSAVVTTALPGLHILRHLLPSHALHHLRGSL